MVHRRLQTLAHRLRLAVTQPASELTRWQRTARFAYDLGRFGARQLRQDRAPQMAAALAFRTLFAILPVLVVGTVVVRAFRGFESLQANLAQFFNESLELDEIFISTPDPATGGEASESLSTWLLDLVAQVDQINIAAVGWVGLLVVIYSAIGLMVTVENSFNMVYRAPGGRSWTRRVPIYWTVLTLGVLAIIFTMYLSGRLAAVGAELGTPGDPTAETGILLSLLHAMRVIWSYVATWLTMFAIYMLVPNTSVAMRPAMVGSAVGTLLIEIGKNSLQAYFQNAISISQLYGSLGLIPVFMFWVYLMWLAVLFGLEVAATLQMLGGRRLEEIEQKKRYATGLVDPAAVVTVMEVVAERFARGRPVTAREVAERTSIDEPTAYRILDRLADRELVRWLDREEGTVIIARPAEQITGDALIDIGYSLVDEGTGRHSSLVRRLRDAQRSLAAETTLDRLVGGAAPDQASGA
ncbi:MAG: YhjD/YihY/BrkB family envelope integrity protein [Planctomycetota bacterium]|jgi:membrane protein